MKRTLLKIIALFAGFHVAAHADTVQFTSENVPFAYEINAEIPSPAESLAKIISRDYRNAPDEFTARELFDKIQPLIKKRLDAAKSVETWTLLIRDQLAPYDFSKAGFPTEISDTTFIPFDNGYAVMFSNGPDFQFLSVPVESAKAMARKLQGNRSIEIKVDGKVVGSQEKALNYSDRKVVLVEITGVTITLEDGTLVGSKAQ